MLLWVLLLRVPVLGYAPGWGRVLGRFDGNRPWYAGELHADSAAGLPDLPVHEGAAARRSGMAGRPSVVVAVAHSVLL